MASAEMHLVQEGIKRAWSGAEFIEDARTRKVAKTVLCCQKQGLKLLSKWQKETRVLQKELKLTRESNELQNELMVLKLEQAAPQSAEKNARQPAPQTPTKGSLKKAVALSPAVAAQKERDRKRQWMQMDRDRKKEARMQAGDVFGVAKLHQNNALKRKLINNMAKTGIYGLNDAPLRMRYIYGPP